MNIREQKITAICDECKNMFDIEVKYKKYIELQPVVTLTYFKCPSCNHKYIMGYMTDTINKKQQETYKEFQQTQNIDTFNKQMYVIKQEILALKEHMQTYDPI